jgi:NAD(P)-dependent dehydrogenase (short-subunit alcohol dehydrogenase family)
VNIYNLWSCWLTSYASLIAPSLMESVGRMGTPEEIAEAVLWLMSYAASFVTGHPLLIDGGYVAR